MKNLYIEKNDRVCKYHSIRENWEQVCCKKVYNFSHKTINEIVSFLLNYNVGNKCSIHSSVSVLDNGLTNSQFEKVLRILEIQNCPNKSKIKTITAVNYISKDNVIDTRICKWQDITI